MSKFENLAFKAVPVIDVATGGPRVKVAVLKSGPIKLTFNAAAYAKLGKPDCLAVEAAENADGAFLRIKAAKLGGGWPMFERTLGEGAPSGACTIKVHPFKPGVTHTAQAAETEWWDDDSAIVAMPDWKAILAGIDDEASPAENEERGEEEEK